MGGGGRYSLEGQILAKALRWGSGGGDTQAPTQGFSHIRVSADLIISLKEQDSRPHLQRV